MESGGKNQRARSEQQRLHEGFEWDAILCIRRRSVSRQVEVALRLREIAERIGARPSRTDESRDRTFSIAHLSFFKMGGAVPILRVIPALEGRPALLDECLARF